MEKIRLIIRELFIPEKGRYINSPWKYIKQSRFFLWFIFAIRAFYYFTIKSKCKFQQINIDESSKHNLAVINHNLWENLAVFNFGRGRVESLLWPFRIIPTTNLAGKTLCIGPKNEGELLCYWAHGFKFKNIIGIDLFSYSPKIKVMDLHDLKFTDNTFDTISCGWVLKYCYDLKIAINEIVRVSKNGTLIAIGFSVDERKNIKENNWTGNKISGGIDEVLALFGSHVGQIYWKYEDLEDMRGKPSIVFRIKKP